jgi:hypothetical protein
MTNLGVFRDSFYNAIHALPAIQANVGPSATGVIVASLMASAIENIVQVTGTSQTFTTDTAANIIANLQTAVATAQKANVGGFASALGETPPLGVPNLFNVSFIFTVDAMTAVTGATLAFGTGVTQGTALSGLSNTALSLTAPNKYVVQVTGPASVTMFRVA